MTEIDEDPEPLTEADLTRIPVFPLPRLVFFPGTTLPLHLFEKRYRTMIEDCLAAGPKALVVAMLEPGHDAEYDHQPPMKVVASAGRIVGHDKLPDGRHNIVLHGMTRVRLRELPMEGCLYRRATATPLTDEGTAPNADISALISCASSVVQVVRREHPEFELDLDPKQRVGFLADLVADRLIADHNLRQKILETLDVGKRVHLVTDAVGELLAMLGHRTSKEDLH